jgi:hypothetical protein
MNDDLRKFISRTSLLAGNAPNGRTCRGGDSHKLIFWNTLKASLTLVLRNNLKFRGPLSRWHQTHLKILSLCKIVFDNHELNPNSGYTKVTYDILAYFISHLGITL